MVTNKNLNRLQMEFNIYHAIVTFIITFIYIILNRNIFHLSAIPYIIIMVICMFVVSYVSYKLRKILIGKVSILDMKLALVQYAERDAKNHLHNSISIECNIADIKTIRQLSKFKEIIVTVVINENDYLLEVLSGVTENYIDELKLILDNCLKINDLSYKLVISKI